MRKQRIVRAEHARLKDLTPKQRKANTEMFEKWFYNQQGIHWGKYPEDHPFYVAQKMVWDYLNPIRIRLKDKCNRLQQERRGYGGGAHNDTQEPADEGTE